ncbi:MAG: ferritin family protein [Conexivisphaera sp.]|jgi:hypothetical protein
MSSGSEECGILCCMALLERAVADAYARAAESASDPAIRAALEFISADSAKHARVLSSLGRDVQCSPQGCGRLMGELWLKEMEAAGRVRDLDGLLSSYDEISSLECAAGEEYSTQAYVKAYEMLHERPSEIVSDLLRMISEDEGRHSRLLSMIRAAHSGSG